MSRFAFLTMGSFSLVNETLLPELRRRFPDHAVDEIDVWDDLVSKRDPRLLLAGAWHFGWDLIRRRVSPFEAITRTPYFFNLVRDRMTSRLAAHDYDFTFQTMSLFDGSVPGTPHFVFTDHTFQVNRTYDIEPPPSIREWERLEATIYENAAVTFVMSPHVEQSLIEQYRCDPSSVECVYGANNVGPDDATIDPDRFHNKDILFVGVQWERKGGPDLVAAFRDVRRTHPDATLTIVGCSPDVEEPGVRIVGLIPPEEVVGYYARTTVFCLPTKLDPFANVFAEAMAFGLPAVGTDIPAVTEKIEDGHNGYIVPVGDRAALADRLNRLLSDPDQCAEFGRRGAAIAQERYTLDALGQRMAATIGRITAG